MSWNDAFRIWIARGLLDLTVSAVCLVLLLGIVALTGRKGR